MLSLPEFWLSNMDSLAAMRLACQKVLSTPNTAAHRPVDVHEEGSFGSCFLFPLQWVFPAVEHHVRSPGQYSQGEAEREGSPW